ncbi:MAG: hypothetical protein E6J91_42445 [Deltaproteobacteria bacterium]|nr:MAG: hypothetical protein E6J91_42445 [Deltaproteobacteria bacterium]
MGPCTSSSGSQVSSSGSAGDERVTADERALSAAPAVARTQVSPLSRSRALHAPSLDAEIIDHVSAATANA